MKSARCRRLAAVAAFAASVGALHPATAAHAEIGTLVPNVELATPEGGRARVLHDARANVIVFVRPDQERSATGLRQLGACQAGFAGKSVHWVAVVSGSASAARAGAMIDESGATMRLLVDNGDLLYGSLGIAVHPVAVIVGGDGRLAAFEPIRSVNYCAVVAARIRRALGEISDAQMEAELAPQKPAEGGDGQAARRYRALAEALFRAKNYPKALDNARLSLDRDPAPAATHALVGKILAASGDCSEAVAAFRRALERDPLDAAAKSGIEACASAR